MRCLRVYQVKKRQRLQSSKFSRAHVNEDSGLAPVRTRSISDSVEEGEYEICFHVKEAWNLFEVCTCLICNWWICFLTTAFISCFTQDILFIKEHINTA